MKTVTQNEYKFLKSLEQDWHTQESDDGRVSAQVGDEDGDMKVTRGIIGSLVKKGIVTIELWEKGYVHPITKEKECDVFLVVVNKEYGSNYKLTNIEVESDAERMHREAHEWVNASKSIGKMF